MNVDKIKRYIGLRTMELEELIHVAEDHYDRYEARTQLDEMHRLSAWIEVEEEGESPYRPEGVEL